MNTLALPVRQTLLDQLVAPRPGRIGARSFVAVGAGALLLWLSAKLQIPFWPVPMTMQTFVVLTLGIAYGARLGAATVLFYLALGAMGLPVFAGTPERGIGWIYMAGPTGGYLVGFVAAAALCGWLSERGWDRRFGSMLVAASVGHLLILALGWAWLALLLGSGSRAYVAGIEPFYAATLVKTLLATACVPLAWRLVGRRAPRIVEQKAD